MIGVSLHVSYTCSATKTSESAQIHRLTSQLSYREINSLLKSHHSIDQDGQNAQIRNTIALVFQPDLGPNILQRLSADFKSSMSLAGGFKTVFGDLNQYKSVVPLFGAAYGAPNKGHIRIIPGNLVKIHPIMQEDISFEAIVDDGQQAIKIITAHFEPMNQRYYGNSLPFGNSSFTPDNIGLLTIEQALGDYAVLISSLKTAMKAENCPVITFGGSYGGMLSAYMNFKYPNLITGSIAASAPIFLLTTDEDRTFFFNGVTKDFADATPNCEPKVRQAFIEVKNLAEKGAPGLQELTAKFKTCMPLKDQKDVNHLLGWIRNSFTNLAMFDYPYPATFFSKLPANPVKFACQYMEDATDLVEGLAKAAGLFYNGTDGKLRCYDIYAEFVECADPTGCGTGPASKAWDYQACTEVHLTAGSNNKTDMFPVLPFTPQMRVDYCKNTWQITPRDDWSAVQFWGRNLAGAKNIVFSNGDLDPWRGGGVLKSPNPLVQVVTIKGGAHHLDLRASNPKDPISVIQAREVEKQAIRKWINS